MGKLEDVIARLEAAGHYVGQDQKSDTHWQVWVPTIDAVANVWSNGTCNVQGKEQADITLLGDLVGKSSGPARPLSISSRQPAPTRTPVGPVASSPKKVFVVYGHDRDARNELEAMLRPGASNRSSWINFPQAETPSSRSWSSTSPTSNGLSYS